jgi:hypothetical protein
MTSLSLLELVFGPEETMQDVALTPASKVRRRFFLVSYAYDGWRVQAKGGSMPEFYNQKTKVSHQWGPPKRLRPIFPPW